MAMISKKKRAVYIAIAAKDTRIAELEAEVQRLRGAVGIGIYIIEKINETGGDTVTVAAEGLMREALNGDSHAENK